MDILKILEIYNFKYWHTIYPHVEVEKNRKGRGLDIAQLF